MEAPRSYGAPHAAPPPLPPTALADEVGREDAPPFPLADPLRRVGAHLLDGLFGLAVVAPGALLCGIGAGLEREGVLFTGLMVVGLAVLTFLVYQCWLLTTEGQTVGKQTLGLRIVRADDGGNPGFAGAVLLRGLVPRVLSPLSGGLFPVADVVCLFVREDRRALHDLIAGTQVIDERDAPH